MYMKSGGNPAISFKTGEDLGIIFVALIFLLGESPTFRLSWITTAIAEPLLL
jgi:hypothetical protein